MEKRTFTLILILILIAFSSGCIDELVPVGDDNETLPDASVYELEFFLDELDIEHTSMNTTTFYLSNNGSVRAVHTIENASSMYIIPFEDVMGSGDDPVSNIVIVADAADQVNVSSETFRELSLAGNTSIINYTLSESKERGQKKLRLNFSDNITGFVAYTLTVPGKQDFQYMPTHPSVVRIILPPDYNTGNPFIGKVQPEPDERFHDASDREVLVWHDLRVNRSSFFDMGDGFLRSGSQKEVLRPLSIKIYPTSAPRMLLIGMSILLIGVLVVLVNYYRTRRRLERLRDDIEKDFKGNREK
ncbi:MAG: DUF5803 family protein [Euryarchaeota archaeon]|nr:DUF5803 family protein [Euryarchaeota archaeon]